MGAAEGNITTLGAGLLLAAGEATAALDLANKKSWILLSKKPSRTDINNIVYLGFDTNYFRVDTSKNLSLSNTFWKKDVSNNLYFNSGKIGIGSTNPGANYALDVLTNINCAKIYRNGTPISSTLSLFNRWNIIRSFNRYNDIGDKYDNKSFYRFGRCTNYIKRF